MDDSGEHNTQGGGYVSKINISPVQFVNCQGRTTNEPKMSMFKCILEALTDENINMIGVCGHEKSPNTGNLLEKVSRIAKRDNLFDVIETITLKGEINWGRIQQEIADVLSCSIQEEKAASCLPFFSNQKIVAERARQLSEWIKKKEKVLLIVSALDTRLGPNWNSIWRGSQRMQSDGGF